MTFFASLLGSDFLGSFLMFAGDTKISFGIYDIAKSLTIPGWVVITILLIQSVYMIAVGIERWLTYNKAKQQSRQYAPKVAHGSEEQQYRRSHQYQRQAQGFASCDGRLVGP